MLIACVLKRLLLLSVSLIKSCSSQKIPVESKYRVAGGQQYYLNQSTSMEMRAITTFVTQ